LRIRNVLIALAALIVLILVAALIYACQPNHPAPEPTTQETTQYTTPDVTQETTEESLPSTGGLRI